MSFWARKTQFWQSCRSFSAEIIVFRCSDSEKRSKTVFPASYFSSKCFLDKKNAVFTTPTEKSLNSSFSSQSSEMIGKPRSSSKNFYHPIFPQDTENSLLTLLALSFFPEDKTFFCSKTKGRTKLHIFKQSRFYSKCLLDTRNAKVTTMLKWIR